MKKRLFSIGLVLAALTTQTSCESKCDTLILADLAFVAASIAVPQVAVAAPLIMNTVLKNLEDECVAERAAETQRSIRVDYRPDSNSVWSAALLVGPDSIPVYEVVAQNAAMEPGGTDPKNDGFKFRTPGQYRFNVSADIYNVVPERSEDNNLANRKNGTVGRLSSPPPTQIDELSVIVFDPNGQLAPNYDYQTKPTVCEYLGEQ
jgi:hypothetical protein